MFEPGCWWCVTDASVTDDESSSRREARFRDGRFGTASRIDGRWTGTGVGRFAGVELERTSWFLPFHRCVLQSTAVRAWGGVLIASDSAHIPNSGGHQPDGWARMWRKGWLSTGYTWGCSVLTKVAKSLT